MNAKLATYRLLPLLLASFILLSCQADSPIEKPAVPTPRPTLAVESESLAVSRSSPVPSAQKPTNTPTSGVASPDAKPTEVIVESASGADALAPDTGQEENRRYSVVFVEQGDTLNIRSGPGVANDVVGELSPGDVDVEVTGTGQNIQGSLWLPVTSGRNSGWVNSRFITEIVNVETFCLDNEPTEIIEQTRRSIDSQDGNQLAELVAEGRGLRFRRHWWNPEVIFEKEDVSGLFESEKSYSWGIADGTGDPIQGTFTSVMSPLFERNLVPASETGCNEIIHSGTAGTITLPPSYEGVNYYSVHRPAGPDEFELDWGTWVLGIEKWQGQYYLSFLVHYEWEI